MEYGMMAICPTCRHEMAHHTAQENALGDYSVYCNDCGTILVCYTPRVKTPSPEAVIRRFPKK